MGNEKIRAKVFSGVGQVVVVADEEIGNYRSHLNGLKKYGKLKHQNTNYSVYSKAKIIGNKEVESWIYDTLKPSKSLETSAFPYE